MDIITYALSKKIAARALSGVQSMSVNGQTLTINTKDSGVLTITFPTPKDGVSVTDIDVNANNQIVFIMSDGSEIISGKIPTVKGDKGDPGVSPTITENADNTDKIYKLDIETVDGKFTTPNLKGADGTGGEGASTWSEISDKPFESLSTDFSVENGELKVVGTGEENTIESISVNGTPISVDENKNVDITVPSIDGLAKTEDIPTKVSELTNDSGYLTEHQDISGKVDKVDGKSLIADTEIERLASVDNYDDTQVKTQIQAVANGLMDSVGYSADYKTIDIIAKNGVKKSVNVAPIISHASITELSDVDTTNKATGKALVYNATTSKHEYADVSGTDEKVKMDASTDAKYLGELLDNVTIANENGELKVKKLDGQEVTITEINYLKGLTMNVMDLVNMFSNGGVKIINTPVATYAELLTIDKSSFIDGISYLVYVLADENHNNAKTTYLVDKVSETPTYFGFADSQRDFTTNPIDLATEITGKLGISNMDSDAIKALFTVDDTYKTETVTNNAFSTHGAKALYDELLLAIGNKANNSDLTSHKDDIDIHVSTEDRTKWDSAKTHADSAHAPSNAQENVIETVKVNGTALEVSNKAVNVTVPTTVAELTDSADYAKTADVNDSISALQTNKANTSDLTAHTGDSVIHVTAENKTLWNTVSNKVNKEDGKALLADTDKTNYDDAVTKAHTHENKEVLDGITSDKVTYWDNKSDFSGSYNDLNDKPTIDAELSNTSENAIQNKVVTKEINKLYSDISFNDFDTATDGISFTDAEDGNMLVTDWTKNLLNPTLQTVTKNGVTCTNNGDGTYTLNGTASGNTYFNINTNISLEVGKEYKIVGCKDNKSSYYSLVVRHESVNDIIAATDGNTDFIADENNIIMVYVYVNNGIALDNVIIKPMLTTDLSATYDDFVPYSGYDIKTCGKNLLNVKSISENQIYDRISVTIENGSTFILNGKYELNIIKDIYFDKFSGTILLKKNKKYIFSADGIVDNIKLLFRKVGTYNTYVSLTTQETKYIITPDEDLLLYFNINVTGQIEVNNLRINVQIEEVSLDATEPTDFEPYTCETITVTNDTESPAFGLKSHKGITNIISPGNVKCVYPTNESGKGVLDSLYNKDKMLTEQNESLSVIGKCKNLLNPTLRTVTKDGITCTDNGDGTYTFNGTATGNVFFDINRNIAINKGTKYKVVCFKDEDYVSNKIMSFVRRVDTVDEYTFNNGSFVPDTENCWQFVKIAKDVTVSNLVAKPMITTNLNATYDDFVPYTGDGETLTHDVAEIRNDLGGLTFSTSGTTLTITDGTNTWTLGANS